MSLQTPDLKPIPRYQEQDAHSGSAGTRPALTSEDLPLPGTPTTATNRRPSSATQRRNLGSAQRHRTGVPIRAQKIATMISASADGRRSSTDACAETIGAERRVRMRVVLTEDVEFERRPERLALGELLLDRLGRGLPFLCHIARRGDEDPNELRRRFAHIACDCSLVRRRSASGSPAPVGFPVPMLSSNAPRPGSSVLSRASVSDGAERPGRPFQLGLTF
jgi:hypothetical protein